MTDDTKMSNWGGCLIVGFMCLATLAPVSWAAEQFVLTVPGQDALRSTAELAGGELVITDADGRIFRYQRRPELDGRTGDYLAFYCAAARRYLRWPASGTGRMFLGERTGATLAWKESRMQIRRLGPPATVVPGDGVGGGSQPGMLHFAVLRRGGDSYVTAQIDQRGQLNMYASGDSGWQLLETSLAQRLTPGAPLALSDDPGNRIPTVYVVDQRGRLMKISDGRRSNAVPISNLSPLVPNTYQASSPGSSTSGLCLVDAAGRLREVDLIGGRSTFIDDRAGQFLPGSPLAVTGGRPRQVVIVDRSGNLLQYTRQPSRAWRGPTLLDRGFLPATPVSVSDGGPTTAVAATSLTAVDARGKVHLLRGGPGAWKSETLVGLTLPPASPVAWFSSPAGRYLSAIDGSGRWLRVIRDGGTWRSEVIADGFIPGAPVGLYDAGALGMAVDRRGRLVAARHGRNGWICSLCDPGFPFAPTLVSRSLVPGPALPPVEIRLTNRHDEDLSVRIFDKRVAGRPQEISIPAGESRSLPVDRDAGAMFEEVYLAPGAFGEVVQQVNRYPLPPRSLYDVVVYADRVTSVYFDRTTNRSEVPDSVQRSLVSLGVFPLPPGELLRPDAQIDVYGEARYQRNPGAAAWFGKPE
jgi:hypothetical protein